MYLDDIIIYSSTQEEHIEHLSAVFKCFRLHGLKLKPSKREFFKEKIDYLGHSVSSKGVWPSRDNLKAITKYPEPTMYTAIKGFIRLVGHYRCFIKDFAKIADRLHEYARGDTAKKKKEWVVLNEAARSAFQKLKKTVMRELQCIRKAEHLQYIIAIIVWLQHWRQVQGWWPSLPVCNFQVRTLATVNIKMRVMSVVSQVDMSPGKR